MMDVTNRHCRYFWRLLCDKIILYTEMVVTKAILHGNRDRFLSYSDEEQPLILQLGGDNPKELAQCAQIAQQYGYSEVNLNVGCPSERVQSGNFGACFVIKLFSIQKWLSPRLFCMETGIGFFRIATKSNP